MKFCLIFLKQAAYAKKVISVVSLSPLPRWPSLKLNSLSENILSYNCNICELSRRNSKDLWSLLNVHYHWNVTFFSLRNIKTTQTLINLELFIKCPYPIHISSRLANYSYSSIYSEIPLLRPPKIKTFYPLQTLFWNFKLFFSSFSTTSVHLIRDHFWDCPSGL